METSVASRELSDGSVAYEVVIIEGSQTVVIACVSEADALALQHAFEDHASYLMIEGRA
jgi:hypothetical protein